MCRFMPDGWVCVGGDYEDVGGRGGDCGQRVDWVRGLVDAGGFASSEAEGIRRIGAGGVSKQDTNRCWPC